MTGEEKILEIWNDHKNRENWYGEDGTEARITLEVIETVLNCLDVKIKGIND